MATRPYSGARAILEAAAATNPIAQIVLEIINAFLGDARSAVLPGGRQTPPDMSAFPGDEAWTPRVVRSLAPALGRLYDGRWRAMDVTADPRAWVTAYLEAVPSRLRSFPAQAFDFVRGVLADGIRAGESIPQLRDRVGAALQLDAPSRVMIDQIARLDAQIADPDLTPAQRDAARAARRRALDGLTEADRTWHWRADRIARTETTGALNAATVQSLVAQSEMDGTLFRVQWVATRHPPASLESEKRTRKTHYDAHRQTVPVGTPFTVGDAQLAYPGDPRGPAQEVINCRCAVVAIGLDGPGVCHPRTLSALAGPARDSAPVHLVMQPRPVLHTPANSPRCYSTPRRASWSRRALYWATLPMSTWSRATIRPLMVCRSWLTVSRSASGSAGTS